jgi:hypothetical protein
MLGQLAISLGPRNILSHPDYLILRIDFSPLRHPHIFLPRRRHPRRHASLTPCPSHGRIRIVIELFLSVVYFDHFQAAFDIGRGFDHQSHLVSRRGAQRTRLFGGDGVALRSALLDLSLLAGPLLLLHLHLLLLRGSFHF